MGLPRDPVTGQDVTRSCSSPDRQKRIKKVFSTVEPFGRGKRHLPMTATPGDAGTQPIVGADPGSAFSNLYRTHRLPMIRLATVITGHSGVAEELVHDAFVKVHERWASIENPGGYLRRVVTNLAIGYLRRLRRERDVAPSTLLQTADPELDETWRLVRLLPARQRAVLALRFYEDMTEAQIADVLGLRLGTVKSTLHRALARLRRDMS